MTPEQIKKDIEMKELLNIPYDSKAYELFLIPTELTIQNLSLVLQDGDLYLSYKDKKYSYSNNLTELFNGIIPNFFLNNARSYYSSNNLTEFIKGVFKINNTSYDIDNTTKVGNIIDLIYNSYITNGKSNTNTSMNVNITSSKEHKIKVYEEVSHNPEKLFKQVFHPTINTSRLEGAKPRSNWRSPFPSESFKGKVLMMDKTNCIFAIEYLWGKKVNTNANGGELMRVLASLPNTNFRVNDVQVLRKLTDQLYQKDVKSLKTHFESCGIKSASNLRRWRKRLTLTE